MGTRSWELITTDESTVLAESVFDPTVVENSESNGRFPNPSCTDESDGFEPFGESDDLVDQPFTSETIPGRRRGQFTNGHAVKT